MAAYTHPMAPGGNAGASPLLGGNAFQNFLNMGIDAKALQEMLSKGKGKAAGLAGKYGPVVSKGVTRGAPLVGAGLSLLQGDVGGAVGAGLGGVLGSALGPVGAVGGSMLGGMLGSAAQSGIAGLVSGGQDRQLTRGESPTALGIGEGKGIESLSIDQIRELAMMNPEVAERLSPLMNQNLDRQMQRQMQLNQQLGQLTGGLNQQKYMAQLAGGAQAQAGETTRSMINSANPYAASVFRYGG
tara:strand:+ start:62 stop:787 length:726 start_codon:yes stop_codon:yes gene_type:complete